MQLRQQNTSWGGSRSNSRFREGGPVAERLLNLADAGLMATICIAPFVFGGRHDLGRLVFVSLVAVTSAAWFVRQCLLPKAHWTRTAAYGVLLSAIALLALQLVPLPVEWLARLSPRTVELLPLWTSGDAAGSLGTWQTLSLTPRETTLALAMLLSYGLLFIVLTQRVQSTADVERLLNTVAVAAVLMAGFGLLQFFTSNGQLFWCYVHPYRTTDKYAMGSFMNRNHFASFLVLGVGPLVRWLVSVLRAQAVAARHRPPAGAAAKVPLGILIAALTIVVLAIALSLSRGGTIALVTATVVLGAIYWRWRLVDAKYLYGLVGIGVLLLGLLSIYGYDQLTGRLESLAAGSLEAVDRQEGRRRIWAANLEAIQQGWLTGAGAGSHREINPVYLKQSSSKDYTHAENGYLQVATELGIVGIGLLTAGFGLCGVWCVACLRRLGKSPEQLCFGAAAAGLAASAVHSLVDFVWYIPACLSVALVLAACVLRLAQNCLPEEKRAALRPALSRSRWLESTAVVFPAAIWTAYAFIGPAMASIHWDRYLRADVANVQRSRQQWAAKIRGTDVADESLHTTLNDMMIRHLENALRWDPSFGRAHFELAQRYLDLFELKQQGAENALGVSQIGDAARASTFASPDDLRAWLARAVGANGELLYRAHDHARRAVTLSPLEGEAYVLLANLCFLDRAPQLNMLECAEQGRRVRPNSASVLFELGRQRLAVGDWEAAIEHWAKCYNDPGPHQLRIVYTIAGRQIPAAVFLDIFHPDWRTLQQIWSRYRQNGQPEDLAVLVAYAAQVTERDVQAKNGIPPVYLWMWQATMHANLEQKELALKCLQQAYQCDQHVYDVRYMLGYALMDARQFAEAEPHLRWCLARRPENKGLSNALVEITKLRLAQRNPESMPANFGNRPPRP